MTAFAASFVGVDPRIPRRGDLAAWLLMVTALTSACLELPQPPPPPSQQGAGSLAIGESRSVLLYSMRLDVTNYEKTMTLDDLLALPEDIQERTWLYNLDLNGHDGSPRLLDNALAQIRDKDPYSPDLSIAERNMVRLLRMTPGNADLSGTRLEELLNLGPKIGIASQEVLADAMGIEVDDSFVSQAALGKAVVNGVIGSHPNARFREGSKSAAYPDGKIPVPTGYLPITLADIAKKFTNLPQRFGAYSGDGVYHPGFVVGTTEAKLLQPDFRMVIRANANALPFKGVDLGTCEMGSVSSIGKDGDALFDFNDPDWLRIEGIVAEPAVTKMTFQMVEHPTWAKPGTSPVPSPWGNSDAWKIAPWTVERVIVEAAFDAFAKRDYHKEYFVGASKEPLVEIDIAKGWMTMKAKADAATPPPPMYIWDLMAEVGQVRLHDGPDPLDPSANPIAEGEANVRFSLTDISVGVTSAQITDMVKRNLERDPQALIGAAANVMEQHSGAPDIFYYRPRSNSPHAGTDWLFYIDESDIPKDAKRDGSAYTKPGFFADEQLTKKLSSSGRVDNDETHEKLPVSAGDVVYCTDDQGAVFRLVVGAKPSPARLRITVQRVK